MAVTIAAGGRQFVDLSHDFHDIVYIIKVEAATHRVIHIKDINQGDMAIPAHAVDYFWPNSITQEDLDETRK